ncbi:response regulator [Aquimarina brevivitae]|uniref:histidine kinase n=1 Tax=Aquimarina brevivitae TaxID=323412 RepID=A0A4Q7PF58_9FLAO|nr:response regulator [Aquimarina brevivitae]RZS99086.1 signal transduction histidine kinase [Aquimarina brevivitae]
MNKVILFFVAFCISIPSISSEIVAETQIDSLDYLLSTSEQLRTQNKMLEALEFAFKGVTYAHKIENEHYLSYAYFMIGTIQYEILDYKNAKSNLKKALAYSEKTEDQKYLPYILQALGNLCYEDDDGYEEALTYYLRGLQLAEGNVPDQNLLIPLYNVIWTFMDLGRYPESYPYLEQAERINTTIADSLKPDFSTIHLLQARKYTYESNYTKAKAHFDSSYTALNTQEKNWIRGKSYYYKYSAELFEKMRDYPKALAAQKQFYANEVKVFENARLKNEEITNIRTKLDRYEQELLASSREKELLQDLQRNNLIIIYISFLVLILLIIVIFFYYRSYKSKKESNKILESRNMLLEEAKAKEEKLSKVKSQFISTITHELRTPLYGIIGISSLLSETKKQSNEDEKLVSSLKFSAEYLLDLVNKVLKISKVDSEKPEKMVVTPTPTNLHALCQNIIKSFEYQAEAKNNTLVLDFDETIPSPLEIDTLRFSEILINLIGNGIKFTTGGTITLRVRIEELLPSEVTLRFEVEDTGIGIPEDQKESIFEEFTQIGNPYDNKQGTGLGLSIVKNLLLIMDSEIECKSTFEEGSVFFFSLALQISNSSDDTPSESKKLPMEEVLSAKILVAEDNKINQLVTKNLLTSINCTSTIVENGIEAIQALQNEEFDLILMDLNMPVLDGLKATQKIRQFNSHIPIIALTAAEIEEVEKDCKKAGFDDLINKPLTKIDLNAAIRRNLKPNKAKSIS